MSLITVRNLLLETSGRYDLTSADLDSILNRAQRRLDSRLHSDQFDSRAVVKLAANDRLVQVDNLRAVGKIWLYNAAGQRAEVSLLDSYEEFRGIKDWKEQTTLVQEMASVTSPSFQGSGKVCCVESKVRPAQAFSDATVVERVNLTNAVLVAAAQPPSPTELAILIEDGLLLPVSPSLDISAGTITIVGTDKAGAALTEVVDCSSGAGSYKTTGRFKTVASVTAADFDYLVTGDEKITIRTGRLSFLEDLDLTDSFDLAMFEFYPVPTEDLMVEIVGEFWTKTLSADADSTRWTERPDLLVLQAMSIMEGLKRNREGKRDFDEQIAEILFEMDIESVWKTEKHARNTMSG